MVTISGLRGMGKSFKGEAASATIHLLFYFLYVVLSERRSLVKDCPVGLVRGLGETRVNGLGFGLEWERDSSRFDNQS